MYVLMYSMCVTGDCRVQKWALDLMELELQAVMSHHVGDRN